MFNWIKNKEASVAEILSTWTKTIEDLETHALQKAEEAFKHNLFTEEYKKATALAEVELKKVNDLIVKMKAVFE